MTMNALSFVSDYPVQADSYGHSRIGMSMMTLSDIQIQQRGHQSICINEVSVNVLAMISSNLFTKSTRHS